MLGRRRVGVEITPLAVRVAVVRRMGRRLWTAAYTQSALGRGVFVPSWEGKNIRHEDSFGASVRQALRAAHAVGCRVGLALPDLTAHLRVLESERPPTDPIGLRKYATWRLRDECPPSPARIAPAFFLNGQPTRGYLAVLLAEAGAIAQIERAIRAAGAVPARITSTATALFNLLDGAPPLAARRGGVCGLLLLTAFSATFLVASGGAPIFARAFRRACGEAPGPTAIGELGAEVVASLDWCANAGLKVPEIIALGGEFATAPGLADALTQHVNIPCRLAELPFRMRGRHPVPPEGIGALAAALS